jgi:O-antigen/teichoic acid export membrane protein
MHQPYLAMKALRLKISDIWSLFWNSSAAKSIRITGFGVGISSAIGLLVTPIISRIFTPEAYGLSGLYFSSIAILLSLSTLSFTSAIVVTRNKHSLYRLIAALKLLIIVSSIVCFLAVLIFKPFIMHWLEDRSNGIWLWLLPIGLLFSNLTNMISQLNVGEGKFKKNATAQVMMSIVAKPFSIIAGWLSHGYYLILIVFDMLSVIPAVLLQKKKGISDFLRVKMSGQLLVRALNDFRKYPLFILPAEFLSNLSLRSPFIVISTIYSIEKAGSFLFASTMLQIPLTLVWNTFNPVFLQQGTRLYKEDKQKLNRFINYTNYAFFLGGLIPTALLTVFGQEIFVFVFGKSWADAGGVCQYIAVYYLFRLSTSPFTGLYRIGKVEHLSLINQVVLLLFRIVPLLVGFYLFDYATALALFSIGSVLGYLFGFWQVGKLIELKFWKTFVLQGLIFIGTCSLFLAAKYFLL